MSDTEAAPEQKVDTFAGKRSAVEQDSIIPVGWKPTASKPVPVVRCVAIKKDGTRCKAWSIRGYTKCRRHAGPGAMMEDGNVNKYAEGIIEAARLRLIDSTDLALDTLDELIQPGTSEGIRLKAATEVLDRAGIRGGFEIDVETTVKIDASAEIAARLEKLCKGAATVNKMKAQALEDAEDPSIVDAELVTDEDDNGQDTLF